MNKIVNKAIDITKRYFFMLALTGMMIGFSAFKFTEKKLDTAWYSVTVAPGGSPENEEELLIGNETDAPFIGSSEDQCGTENETIMCSVQLTLDDPQDKPETIAEARDTFGTLLTADHPEE